MAVKERCISMRNRVVSGALALSWLVGSSLLASGLAAGEPKRWNRFRGPNGSGVIQVSELPTVFGTDQKLIWKTPLPPGHSSPVLSDDRIYLTAVEDDHLWTLCLDRDSGRVLWRQRSPRNRAEKLDRRNNPAAASPALDEEENVYVFFGDFGLLSYDRSGRERWRISLGPFDNLYGMGASPVVAGNRLFLVCDQQTGSFLLSVDKDSGERLWRVDRPEATSGHSTPILYQTDNENLELLVAGSFLLSAYHPANGEKLWWVRGLSFEMKSTPVMNRGMLFVNGYATPLNQPDKMVETEAWNRVLEAQDKDSNGRLSRDELPDSPARGFFPFVDLDQDGFLKAEEWSYYRDAMASKNAMLGIRLGGRGDMTDSNLKWEYHRSVSQLPSPLLYKDILYMIDDGGIATSFRPHTGEVIARSRIKGAIDKYFASPVAADDKIFLVSETCKVAVLKPDGSLEVLVVNDLESTCYATPALAQGRIYIRTTETLYAFGEKDIPD